jgi:hypothetical protein
MRAVARGANMRAIYVMKHIFAEPFRPFRIRTVSGRTFEIRHPEVVEMSVRTLTIFTPLADIPDTEEPWYKISLSLIEAIEPLDAPVAGSANEAGGS